MKILKIILIIIGIVVILVLGVVGYVSFFLPNIAVKDIRVEITPERVERGEYLANHVMVCMDCHSRRDWSLFSGPISAGTLGAGSDGFTPEMGFPGTFYAPNITPANLTSWSDGEVYRAITSGVNRDGDPLFPVMPYHSYGHADQEDIYAVIAYLRTLKPIENEVPPSNPDFPMSIIMHLMPAEAQLVQRPRKEYLVAYGNYLATISACADCHTPFEKGQPVEGMHYAGGREFAMSWGTLHTPNLTPDKATGIGAWTELVWLNRFAAYDSIHKLPLVTASEQFNTLMPWHMYAQMSTDDLKAIYAYLQSLPPITNEVEKVTYREGK
jgi:mono/diheme cytochrome c family protein